MTKKFYENDLSLDTLWRSIVLIGKNTKSYKFALGKSIIQLASEGKQNLSMKDLAPYFARNTIEHVKSGNKQGTGEGNSGPFLEACEKFINNEITEDNLFSITEKTAFGNVIERFHTVNQGETPKSFYDWSSFKKDKNIVIKDEVFNLLQSAHGSSLVHEIEARWKLVENAWQLSLDPKLLDVQFDDVTKLFFINKNEMGKTRRIDVTHSRDALNGYQKGHCFFCFDSISVNTGDSNICHVDHFFAHTLFDRLTTKVNFNGVWNLVLACSDCNSTKSAKLPRTKYLDRLHTRNEFYISSHLPLRESILKTGDSELQRRQFLQSRYNEAEKELVTKFEVELKKDPRF
jgi:hypothetical protein